MRLLPATRLRVGPVASRGKRLSQVRLGLEASRRVIVSGLLTAALAPSAPALAAAAAAVGTAAALQTYAIESSERDPRSYRGLQLPNGLRVLLCSDPTAKKAAAAMDVQVGWMSDPPELPGLAHFCEHMLFLGTADFPAEGEFERYISAYGGSNNAYTDSEDTCYYFDVTSAAFPGALERFSGFFTAPLFTESATAREVSAIESEHSKNLQADFWRYNQLLKLRATPSHPFAQFGTGNARTLRGGDATAREALLAFHREHYVASQMSLALVGPQPLAELQRLAAANFGRLPARAAVPASLAYDALPLPFAPGQGGSLTLMRPVTEQRTLCIAWCVPVDDFERWAMLKPDVVWRLLLGTRVRGGLVKALRSAGLISGLDASVEEQTRAFSLLSVTFDLTEAGLRRWPDVAAALFGYLRLLRDGGVPAHVFEEAKLVNALGFRYSEPTEPAAFATTACAALPFYPPARWLTGPALLFDGAEPDVAALLARCAAPDDALFTLTAPQLPGDTPRTEPIYGTQYGAVPIDAAGWARRPVPDGLAAPAPNRFLPRSLAIKPPPARAARGAHPAPRLVASAPAVRLHHWQDTAFGLPRAFVFFELRTPQVAASADSAVAAELYTGLLADALVDDTAEAAAAGLFAGVSTDYRGFTLAASGYDDRLAPLAATVAAQLRGCALQPLDFERRRASLLDGLANLERRQPVALASYERNLALETGRFTLPQLADAARRVRLADLQAFQRELLPRAELEGLVCGNARREEAEALLAELQAAVPTAPLAPAEAPARRVVRLPRGARLRQHVAANPQEVNGAVEVYFQIGQDTGGDEWRLLGLLSQVVDQAFYSELRTRQQLGYIVGSSVAEVEGVRALVFSVQSSVLPPPQLEERVDAFLADFRGTLAAMPEAELGAYREALAVQVADVDRRLALQASRFWAEIAARRYDYERPWRIAAMVRKLTKPQLLAFFDERIAAGGSERRRLTTHVFSRSAAPKKLVSDALAEEGAGPDYYPPVVQGTPMVDV